MESSVLELTGMLRDELAANDQVAVDTRTIPLRFHHLKAMGQSPAHCLHSLVNDNGKTLAIRIGAGTHGLLLGQPVVEFTGKTRAGKEWKAFEEANGSAVAILNRKEYARASEIVAAVRAHPVAAELLLSPGVLHEKTINWQQQGRIRRTTPDARSATWLAEFKTGRCVEPGKFVREATWRGYHAQLADQSAAIEFETGKKPEKVFIVAVETVRPYVVQVLELSQRALEQGERICRLWMERFLACEAANEWPGYCLTTVPFDIAEENDMDFMFEDDGEDSATEGNE